MPGPQAGVVLADARAQQAGRVVGHCAQLLFGGLIQRGGGCTGFGRGSLGFRGVRKRLVHLLFQGAVALIARVCPCGIGCRLLHLTGGIPGLSDILPGRLFLLAFVAWLRLSLPVLLFAVLCRLILRLGVL